uniref:PB1 domain-containing protein n=3 Tax=Esox lucius TaxID=8010 RepID=A0AAY5L925_ESOLU
MLVKVQYQGVKKFVKYLSDSTFQDFLNEVKGKFGLARTAALQVFDDTDTNVEEDIFHELIEGSPHLCLTVRCPEENISAGLSEEPESAVENQTAMVSNSFNIDAEKAKRTVQDALEKKSGGEEVLEEYQTTKTLKHSTRRQLVNIVVSHMTEIHG